MLERQIVTGVEQVVVLGAGLDTRAARKPADGVTYFEIDDAATLALKESCYRQRDIDVDERFIPGNYVTDGLIDMLDDNGFDFQLPTYIIWEGNTMYLPMDRNTRIVTDLTEHLREFRLSFDYMAGAVIENTTGDAGITSMVASFAAMGAPWLSGIDDVQRLASELGLSVVDNFTTGELNSRYRPGRTLGSPIFTFYSVCTLGFAADVMLADIARLH
jgi:methyltransferase (TIGR00027 family)